MARTIKHDVGETVLLVAKVSAINITRDDEVMYRVRIDGLGGDHWIPEADIFDETKSESDVMICLGELVDNCFSAKALVDMVDTKTKRMADRLSPKEVKND